MEYIFDILRRKDSRQAPYHQRIRFVTENKNETVATALLRMNQDPDRRDEDGKPVDEIGWEAGCLQKKCGACAMLINRKPALACDTFLRDLAKGRKADTAVIMLEPLSKFPVIRDLITDRSVLFDNLKTLKVWSGENGEIREKNQDWAFEASRCLQCGCCLEVCPNYEPGRSFAGAAGYAPETRLISTYTEEEQNELRKLYRKHIYNGCGKSLSCMKVCPAGIDLDRLLSRSNAIAVWRRNKKHSKKR